MESKIDLSQVTPVNYKVTVVLVNQFAVTTIQFLNRFSSQCEEKLRLVSEGIYRINSGSYSSSRELNYGPLLKTPLLGLELLEAKLDSIPFICTEKEIKEPKIQAPQATENVTIDDVETAAPSNSRDPHHLSETQSDLPSLDPQETVLPGMNNNFIMILFGEISSRRHCYSHSQPILGLRQVEG